MPASVLPALVRRATLGLLTLACAGCRDAAAPAGGPPYLAVMIRTDQPDGTPVTSPYAIRVREFSGTLPIEQTHVVQPNDTLIVSVPPATYLVNVLDVPPRCGVRDGSEQLAAVLPTSNTTIVRWIVTCRAPVTVATATDGTHPDDRFAWEVVPTGTSQPARAGVIRGTDTLQLDGLAPGAYDFVLRHVAEHCVVISDGGTRQRFVLEPAGGVELAFRIACADVARRPRITAFGATWRAGAAAFHLRATDPDRDVERYAWTVTDCRGRSVVRGGWLGIGGFSGNPRTRFRDTVVVLGAFTPSLLEPDGPRCGAVRVADSNGNWTPVTEFPLAASRGRAPVVARMNALLVGTVQLAVQLEVSDPDADFVGTVVVHRTRDGVFVRPPDTVPDEVVFESAGVVGAGVPPLVFGGFAGRWDDYYGVTLYAIDRAGNFTVAGDDDLFR